MAERRGTKSGFILGRKQYDVRMSDVASNTQDEVKLSWEETGKYSSHVERDLWIYDLP